MTDNREDDSVADPMEVSDASELVLGNSVLLLIELKVLDEGVTEAKDSNSLEAEADVETEETKELEVAEA